MQGNRTAGRDWALYASCGTGLPTLPRDVVCMWPWGPQRQTVVQAQASGGQLDRLVVLAVSAFSPSLSPALESLCPQPFLGVAWDSSPSLVSSELGGMGRR